MAILDLSSQHIQAWRSRMPGDARAAVGDDVLPDQDDAVARVAHEFEITQSRRVLEVIERNDGMLSSPEFGRSRRVRLMAYLMNRDWPDTSFARSIISAGLEAEREEGAEGGAEGGGKAAGDGRPKARFPRLFLDDYRSLAAMARPRMIRSASDADTVEALATGLKEFAQGLDAPPSGGF